MASVTPRNTLSADHLANLMEYHVDDRIVTLPGERVMSVIRLRGTPYETVDLAEKEAKLDQLNRFFLMLSKKEGSKLLIQTYISKTPVSVTAEYHHDLPDVDDFLRVRSEPFRTGRYKAVSYTVVMVLKYRSLDDGIARMRELLTSAETMLQEYDPSILGIEENEYGALFSQIGRFFSLIFNGYEGDVLLSDTRLGDAVMDSTTSFAAYDFIEQRPNRGGKRFATTYDLRDYPSNSSVGMWDAAIEEPCDFVLVQTFHFIPRNEAKDTLKKHANNLTATDGETEQVTELWEARDALTDGQIAFGMYHAALIVWGNTSQEAIDNGARLTGMFANHDTLFVRSTQTNIYTYYAQFPAYTDAIYRSLRSTMNLACGFSLHVVPTGKATGNPPGDGTALMPLMTTKESILFLNAHDSPIGQNNTGEKFAGHLVLTGATGTGKTTLEAAIILHFSRWKPAIFAIDYNQAMRHVLEALGTQYFVILPGISTGINPFQLPDTPALRQHLLEMVMTCAGGKALLSEEEKKQIERNIHSVLTHSIFENRSMSLLVQGIPPKGENSLRARLERWTRGQSLGWVLDAPINQFNPASTRRLAFDGTKILQKTFYEKNAEVVEVLLNTLFFMKEGMRPDGGLLLNVIAEYWVPLSFESTADRIKDCLKAGRTRNEIVIMDTQSPEDAINTPYAADVVQQIPTQIWLPNEEADEVGYGKFGVKGERFAALKKLHRYSRQFLVKQGNQTVIAQFVLDEKLKYWLPLLSSTEENLLEAARIKERLNTNDPAVWLPEFLKVEQEKKNAKK